MYTNVLQLLEILVRSIEAGGQEIRVASILNEQLLKGASMRVKETPLLTDADVVLASIDTLNRDLLARLVRELSSKSLVIVLNAIIGINTWPELTKEFGVRGFTKSFLPVDGGVALFIRRGYDVNFFRKTVEVYRESFIYGPNPIDYNTAYVLYSLAKFVLARRKGVVVEVGTGRGFSTMWLAHAVKETNSYVISLDLKCDRVEYALKVMRELQLSDYVEILCRDAKEYTRDEGDVVFAFIDGKKDEYHQYLEAIEKYLAPGALVLAHNTLSDAHVIKPYIEKVYAPPYKSITIAVDPKGLTLSVYGGRA